MDNKDGRGKGVLYTKSHDGELHFGREKLEWGEEVKKGGSKNNKTRRRQNTAGSHYFEYVRQRGSSRVAGADMTGH